MSEEISKEYSNGEITVVWKPKTCMHSENCWRGLPSVFQPKSKPWINVEGASTEDIIAQVNKCPSGALSYYRNDESKTTEKSMSSKTEIEVTKNGPYLIKGQVEVQKSDGSTEVHEKTTALCRCGMSSNKPYCDGTHRKNDWQE